jgi:hypothetical protein
MLSNSSIDLEWDQFLLQYNTNNDINKPLGSIEKEEKEDKQEIYKISFLEEEKEEDFLKTSLEYVRNDCESLYISTQTKIFFLNQKQLDIETIFWNLPIMDYGKASMGIIKKQRRMIFKTPEQYEEYSERLKSIPYYTEKVIQQINNPNARKIKFKDVRKLTVGISKKDIMNCHGKEKKAFINCFAMILRVCEVPNRFHEVHVKVFNTGKITIPGIMDDNDNLLEITKQFILQILQPSITEKLALIPENEIPLVKKIVKNKKKKINQEIEEYDYPEEDQILNLDPKYKNSHIEYIKPHSGVLINSNFNCGFYIDQKKLMVILQEKYGLEPTYNKSNYPGVKCKYYLNNDLPLDLHFQNGKITKEDENIKMGELKNNTKYTKITFVIFRTGNNLILGNFSKQILLFIFDFVKHILMSEYENIRTLNDEPNKKTKKNKPRKKKVQFSKEIYETISSSSFTISS